MKKATKKQQLVALLIILAVVFSGIFGLVFGLEALTGNLPEREESSYSIFIVVLAIPIFVAVYIIPKLLSRYWGVDLK